MVREVWSVLDTEMTMESAGNLTVKNNDFCRTVNVIVADVRFLTCDGVTFSKKFHVVDCNECIVFITVLTLYRRCVYYTCDLRSTCLCVYIYVVVLVVFSCLQTTSN